MYNSALAKCHTKCPCSNRSVQDAAAFVALAGETYPKKTDTLESSTPLRSVVNQNLSEVEKWEGGNHAVCTTLDEGTAVVLVKGSDDMARA
jgi:hypothetical protein